LAFLLVIAFTIVVQRSLISATMLAGFFSLLMAVTFVLLDAVDVAFAEAAVGAGITTMLLLGTIGLTGPQEKVPRRQWMPLFVTAGSAAMLIYGTFDLPLLGSPHSPAYTHVAPYYIEHAEIETGVPNMVTAVLASYRGYDTLGELFVILTAGLGVLMMLGLRGAGTGSHAGGGGEISMTQHSILRVITKLLIPFILLFALYVQFHGESGPGGGFQAGTLFAAAFILYALVYGTSYARRVIPARGLYMLMALGVLLYAGTGLASFLFGANFLDYGVFANDFASGQLLGIFLVELGVGITVAATMITVFLALAERRHQ